ncbi:MAG TPA: cytochrome c biogenesis protein CcsA [Candidatus Angelobacter sp.]|nr:cytochrome c biogenesis protein CcsA [Candidatus Angelobacter sp.]
MTSLISILLVLSLGALLAVAMAGVAAALAGTRLRPVATGTGSLATEPGPGARLLSLGGAGMLVAGGLLTVALIARTIAVGHAPWSNLHEVSVAFATALVLVHLLMARRSPIGGLAPITALVAAGLVGFALSLPDRIDPLVPALQQPVLLTVHVGSAILAYALAGLGFAAAVGELVQRSAGDRIPLLPNASLARAIGHRAVLLAYPILTAAIVLGSVWANLAWRSYWSNDPKELAAAATWLVFGAYLHVAGRRDRWASLAPWLIVAGFAGVLFTYIGAGLFIVGEHSYGTP